MVYKFVDCTTVEDAREQWISFFLYAEKPGTEECNDCIKACHNWSTEILHSIRFVCTNAFTEGMNNNIKVLKRIAYGYRNQIHFRARILSFCGKKNRPETQTPQAGNLRIFDIFIKMSC